MADHAVGGLGEVFAALDDVGLGELGRNAGRIGLVVVGERDRRAAGKREWAAGEPDEDADGDDDDSGDDDNDDAAHGGHAFFTAMAARSIGRRRKGTPVAA